MSLDLVMSRVLVCVEIGFADGLEIEQHDAYITSQTPAAPDPSANERNQKQNELSRALLASVAKTNISTLQQGLAKQTIYWSGAAWVSGALEQRIEGMREVDLVNVTERLNSFVRLPDAGLVGGTPDSSGPATGGSMGGSGGGGSGGGGGVGMMNNTRHTNQQGDMGYSIPTNASYDFGECTRSLVHWFHPHLIGQANVRRYGLFKLGV
jgi:hypothetical protein